MVYRISSIATFTYFQNQIEQPAELIVLCKMRAWRRFYTGQLFLQLVSQFLTPLWRKNASCNMAWNEHFSKRFSLHQALHEIE